jgi:cytochrome P450
LQEEAARSSEATTLLDLLLDARDEGVSGGHLTDEEVVDQATTFLLAGGWAIHEWW